MSKTLLITGGAGFIGSNFIRHMFSSYSDYKIVILDTLTYAASLDNLPAPALDNTDDRITFLYGNVCNAELVDTLVADADIVVHFAAETHVTRSIFDNLLFFQTDVIGTHTIANAVVKARSRVERFIHISTSEVYGTAVTEKMSEDHPYQPMTPYASAKCGADRLVYSYWATYDIPVVIVRPFNNFGPRQHLEKAIPRFISSVLLGENLTVHGLGEAARDFVHVSDCCRAIDLLIHAPLEDVVGQVYNVASSEHRSILSIAQNIVREMDYDADRITFIEDRPGQVFRHTGDISKIKRVLGWTPQLTWEEGLQRTIGWYRDNREWWMKQLWMRQIPIHEASGKVTMF